VKRIEGWLKSSARRAGQKLSDGGGLYLTFLPGGRASWQLRFLHGGKPATFSIGTAAETSLAEARAARARIRKRWSVMSCRRSASSPFSRISTSVVAGVIDGIQKRGVRDTTQKILQHVRSIFRYAPAKGLRLDNPAEPVIEILEKAPDVVHHPALRDTMRLAGRHSPHGWRSALSTRAREDTDFDAELIDLSLDHVHASDVALANDRGQRLAKRVALMTWWGNALESVESDQEVPPYVVERGSSRNAVARER
jgi:hypothetical protein